MGYKVIFKREYAQNAIYTLFFIFMTSLASIFTMNTLKRDDNIKLILVGLTICVLTLF